ncbi:MAG: pyrroline-5-carboxylate reductase [Caulobacteraceae bacterium]
MTTPLTPLLLVGAGRMGGALIAGWRLAGAFMGRDLIVRDPRPGPAAVDARDAGARLNPPDADLAGARTILLAVKPQAWRDAALEIVSNLAPDATVVSIMAGVGADELAEVFAGRPIARAMPTTAAAVGKSITGLYAADRRARARARALFEPVGAVIDLEGEESMHAVTAASGSAPAFFYAFVEALHGAAVGAGLPTATAARLVAGAVTGAAALMERTGEDPADLRRQVTSPGGTAQAGLEVLAEPNGLDDLLARAVATAAARSRTLSGARR